MKLKESLDNEAEYSKKEKYPNFFYKFSLNPELDIKIICVIYHIEEKMIKVDFQTDGDDISVEEKGKITFTIFSTLSKIISTHIAEYDIKKVVCTAIMKKKLDIYEKLFERFKNDWHIFRDNGSLRALKI